MACCKQCVCANKECRINDNKSCFHKSAMCLLKFAAKVQQFFDICKFFCIFLEEELKTFVKHSRLPAFYFQLFTFYSQLSTLDS